MKKWFIPIILSAVLLGLFTSVTLWATGGDSYPNWLHMGGNPNHLLIIGGSDNTQLVIGYRPPSPTALYIIALTPDAISLAWKGSTENPTCVLVYKTTGYPASVLDGTQHYQGNISSATIENLAAGKTYYFGVWAKFGGVYSLTGAVCAATTSAGYSDPDYGSAIGDTTDETILGNSPIGGFIDFMSQYARLPEKTVGLLGYSGILLFVLLGVACYNRSIALTIICGIGGLALGVNLGVFAVVFLIIAIIGGLALGTLRGGQPN